ncbi:MAG: ATP-binding protein [Candidatus Promineifilaceae bacterium]|jgi:two-component system sensor histidine kinase BaeS
MSTLRTSLWSRLTIAFVFVALIGVTLVAVLANRATSLGFQRYLQAGEIASLGDLQAELATFYDLQGDWTGVNNILRDSSIGPQGSVGGYFLRVLDTNDEVVGRRGGQSRSEEEFDMRLPIMVGDTQVGTLLAEPAGGAGSGHAGEQYLASVNQAILLSGLVAILIALFLGLILARRITRPLSQLTEATHDLAAGDLGRQVPVNSEDELGRLASDFNQMARALELSEAQRRQLLADTAHDLRTPIAVMQSHLEAMLDGVFPMTPENLAAIHEETLHLGRLVEDVRLLSLAETGQLPLEKKPVDLLELTGQVVSAFAPLAESDGVLLESDLQPVPFITADPARLHQVLANLISNAMRFAPLGTGETPTVIITLQPGDGQALITITDNGPGLTAEQQARVFDRFWRSDRSRDRQGGNSGLGLAISKSIVEAHGGQISVTATPGEGATFTVSLPV